MKKELQIVTRAVITDENDYALLGRRKKGVEKGKLAMFGGRVEIGESAREAIAREILEETGLTVTQAELLKTIDTSVTPSEPWQVCVFRCLVAGEITIKPDEHSEAVFLSVDQIRNATDIAYDHKDLLLELLEVRKT